jgi:hypothetical protein
MAHTKTQVVTNEAVQYDLNRYAEEAGFENFEIKLVEYLGERLGESSYICYLTVNGQQYFVTSDATVVGTVRQVPEGLKIIAAYNPVKPLADQPKQTQPEPAQPAPITEERVREIVREELVRILKNAMP